MTIQFIQWNKTHKKENPATTRSQSGNLLSRWVPAGHFVSSTTASDEIVRRPIVCVCVCVSPPTQMEPHRDHRSRCGGTETPTEHGRTSDGAERRPPKARVAASGETGTPVKRGRFPATPHGQPHEIRVRGGGCDGGCPHKNEHNNVCSSRETRVGSQACVWCGRAWRNAARVGADLRTALDPHGDGYGDHVLGGNNHNHTVRLLLDEMSGGRTGSAAAHHHDGGPYDDDDIRCYPSRFPESTLAVLTELGTNSMGSVGDLSMEWVVSITKHWAGHLQLPFSLSTDIHRHCQQAHLWIARPCQLRSPF